MTPAVAAPAGPAPDDDDDDLGALVVGEPVAAQDAEVDDALAALAALLLDVAAARRNRGQSLTPSSAALRPDARRRKARPIAPPAGGEAA